MNPESSDQLISPLPDRVADLLKAYNETALPADLERIERIVDQLGDIQPEPYILPLDVLAGAMPKEFLGKKTTF